jgi:hypothetical protein
VRDATDRFVRSVADFGQGLERAGIAEKSSAIICRAHQQLESIRGEVNYTKLKGMTKELAQASFARDCRKDYKLAFQIVEEVIRSIIEDDAFWEGVDGDPESEEARRVRLELWRFVKSKSGLPEVSASGSEWILQVRQNLGTLIKDLGFKDDPNLG